MKNLLLKFAGASLLALALATSSNATPINGEIVFLGSVSANTIAGTTTVSFGAPQTVVGSSVDYAGSNGQVGSFTNFSFTGQGLLASLTAPVTLWTLPAGWSFDLLSLSSGVYNPGNLTVQGDGIAYGPGSFSATAGVWSLEAAGTFTFTANTTSAAGQGVPDGGTTALLLGAGLVGVSFIARRRKAA